LFADVQGGRASDKRITENCGIFFKLLPEDVVLAYLGFHIAESIGAMQAKLHISAFTKGSHHPALSIRSRGDKVDHQCMDTCRESLD